MFLLKQDQSAVGVDKRTFNEHKAKDNMLLFIKVFASFTNVCFFFIEYAKNHGYFYKEWPIRLVVYPISGHIAKNAFKMYQFY